MTNIIQMHLFGGLNFGSCYFLGRGILGPEEHPCPEDTEVSGSYKRKMALVVCLVAVGTLSPWHNFTITY